ncbi:hypothetical protein GCM10022281_21600 [Sphingomonas rosea]|uniref:PqqD family protein n=1 Tax=Sphingomonas rosea TaxID=335605 RepID=A0ABP7UCH7_9SPHN
MTLFQRSPQAMSAEVGADVVALHAERGFAFGMEGVTASVWQLLDRPRSLAEIVAGLRLEYDVEEDQCRDEVGALLADLRDEGLIDEVTE